jgi:PIN domain nuclease of toxin-antitoxin system
VSAASAWEVAPKFRKGKLPEAAVLESDFESIVVSLGMTELPVTLRHALLSGRLTLVNADPWDRTLIAQAILENLVLVSIERSFESQGVRRLWD